MRAVEIVGLHVEATSGEPLVLLRELEAPHRLLPIFIGDPEAASIALALSGQSPPRPLAHDVMAALVDSVDAHVDALEVTDLRDGAFVAALAISSPAGGRRVDTRPSDGIALAVRVGAPLFVSDAILDEAGTLEVHEVDDPAVEQEIIDDEVAEFRDLLDELDPAEIVEVLAAPDDPPSGAPPPGGAPEP